MCWVTARCSPPSVTPTSTWRNCARWPCLGPRSGDEKVHAFQGSSVPRSPPRPGLSDQERRAAPSRFCTLRGRSGPPRTFYQPTGPEMGVPTQVGRSPLVGTTFGDRSHLCQTPFADGAKNSGPATALVGTGSSSPVPTPLHRRANPATATSCRTVEGQTSASHLADPDRLAGLQRAAHLRGDPAKARRCGVEAILADHSRKQVRQNSLGPLTPKRVATFARVCSTPTGALPSRPILLCFGGGLPSGSQHGWSDLYPIARRYSF